MAVEKHNRFGWARPLGLGPTGVLPNLYDLAIFILIAATSEMRPRNRMTASVVDPAPKA